jgi:Tfp pilus assembly protein FimV
VTSQARAAKTDDEATVSATLIHPAPTSDDHVAHPVEAPRSAIHGHSGPRSHATYLRRRVVAVALLIVLAFLLTVAIGRVGAEAELADRVAGHVVVEPGQTLWDIAADTAPAGVDTRQQLADLQALNGVRASELKAWDVVLLPAR